MPTDQPQEWLAHVSVRQLLLAPLNVSPIFDGQDLGPLVALTDRDTAIIIITGCADGPVRVATQLCPDSPPTQDNVWEVIEEVDMLINGPLYLASPTWAELHTPVLTPSTLGPHRLRVCGWGRHEAPGISVTSSSEQYLVQAWPVTAAADRRVVLDDGEHL